jgi:hypothetical protein
MTLIVVAILPFLIGLVMVIFAKPVGIAMCRAGKANWRMITFGTTDMGMFYPEDKAPQITRIVGCAFLVMGALLLYQLGFPFTGPGRFKATIQAKGYLSSRYGAVERWKISPHSDSPDNTVVTVDYVYGSHSGSLRGDWQGEAYKFSERDER